MPEGDTIHRVAMRMDAALVGKRIERAASPSPRSPIHARGGELAGRRLERAEAKGKHLLLHFSGDAVVHSHLGMNGRWLVRADGLLPFGEPWLLLASGSAIGSVTGGKILRLVSGARARNDPALLQLGPDPLHPDFDPEAAAGRLLGWTPTETVGAAVLDQSLIAGIGNVIRIEACFLARVNPWRSVSSLTEAEALEEGAQPLDHANRDPNGEPAEADLRPQAHALPPLWRSHPDPGPGRRQSSDVLVRRLPALIRC